MHLRKLRCTYFLWSSICSPDVYVLVLVLYWKTEDQPWAWLGTTYKPQLLWCNWTQELYLNLNNRVRMGELPSVAYRPIWGWCYVLCIWPITSLMSTDFSIFRVHAEFQLQEVPKHPFWFTPAQFKGRLIISKDHKHVKYLRVYVPNDKRLNVGK